MVPLLIGLPSDINNGCLINYGTFYASSNNNCGVLFAVSYTVGYTGLCTSAVGNTYGGVEYKSLTGFNATINGGGGTRCWITIGS